MSQETELENSTSVEMSEIKEENEELVIKKEGKQDAESANGNEDVENKNIKFINIRVMNQKFQELVFKIKRTTPLAKVKKAYTEKIAKSDFDFRYRYEDKPVKDDDTPESLEMEEDDIVEAFEFQLGG